MTTWRCFENECHTLRFENPKSRFSPGATRRRLGGVARLFLYRRTTPVHSYPQARARGGTQSHERSNTTTPPTDDPPSGGNHRSSDRRVPARPHRRVGLAFSRRYQGHRPRRRGGSGRPSGILPALGGARFEHEWGPCLAVASGTQPG